MPQLILASQSASRKQLLTEAGYKFIVMPSGIDEVIDMSLPIPEAIEKLSRDKAQSIAQDPKTAKDAVIVAGDSVVVFENTIIGKPKDGADLTRTLTKLSGQTHQFISGYTVLDMESRKITSGFDIGEITFRKLSPQEIEAYSKQDEPYTKAGGYNISGVGKDFVQQYKGAKSTITGLPMEKVEPLLNELGVRPSQH